jgi:hypothetical protein
MRASRFKSLDVDQSFAKDVFEVWVLTQGKGIVPRRMRA